MDLSNIKKVHFVGIGGIGISAVARMMLLEGKRVTGSDNSSSPVTEELSKMGAEIFVGHDVDNITSDIDLVAYTIAVADSNPELIRARELGITMMSYPEILNEVSKNYFTIAICGTHGKTTTTAMLAKILMDAGLEPTVIVGSFLHEGKTNFVVGKSKILVLEADEYRRTFLQITPRMIVINNIDLDHLDYYKDMADIQSAFRSFGEKLGEEDYMICNTDGENMPEVYVGLNCKVLNYKGPPAGGEAPKLIVPGEHNRDNARAAITAAIALGVEEDVARKSLETFAGTWRRLEKKGSTPSGAVIYDDYAHNPGKIRSAIAGLRELYPEKKINVVFMPHLYSRTKILLKELAESLSSADKVFVTDIYAAREALDPTIHARHLIEAINSKGGAEYLDDYEEILNRLKRELGPADLLVTVGAGDIYKFGEKLLTM
ncbi:MAG: Mur ligase domain-containing protein [bacterium]|nr:Mur ligase domain-containing protein [bacterium]